MQIIRLLHNCQVVFLYIKHNRIFAHIQNYAHFTGWLANSKGNLPKVANSVWWNKNSKRLVTLFFCVAHTQFWFESYIKPIFTSIFILRMMRREFASIIRIENLDENLYLDNYCKQCGQCHHVLLSLLSYGQNFQNLFQFCLAQLWKDFLIYCKEYLTPYM